MYKNRIVQFLKIIAEIVISYLIAYFVFDKSVLIFIFLIFTVIYSNYKEKKTKEQDSRANAVGITILFVLSLVGLFLIILGYFVLANNTAILIGAFIFAPTFSNLLVWGTSALIKNFLEDNKCLSVYKCAQIKW